MLTRPGYPIQPPTPDECVIKSVAWRGHWKEVSFECGAPALKLPRSACVSKGDRVRRGDGEAWVRCHNGEARLLPTYVAREQFAVGGLSLELLVKEITEAEEFT